MNTYFKREISIIFLLLIFNALNSNAQNVVVKTTKGYVEGITENQSVVFKGIPYAKPPVQSLRFMAPQAVAQWNDTLSCTAFGNIASQYDGTRKRLQGDENCLTLNVYKPVKRHKGKLPVLVWIHGGGMTSGSGKGQNGHSFSDQDGIITVTINYRLGVFGFLYLGELGGPYATSGNNGLLDCIMALKWVKENIKSFGGNPSRVTVMGQSAGAKLTSTLRVSPLAKGYYHQLILESGSVQCIRDTITAKTIRSLIFAELKINQPSDILNISTEKLIEAQAKALNGAQGTNYFGPVEDGIAITEDPYTYVRKNKKRGINYLIGTTKEESLLFMRMDKRLYHPDTTVLKAWFGNNYSYVLSAYQKEAKHSTADSAAIKVLTQYMYQMHSYRLASELAKFNRHIYMYRFDYSQDGSGSTHAQEIPYLWFLQQPSQPNHIYMPLALQMHHAWVHFIKERNPGKISSKPWPRYRERTNPIMVFDSITHLSSLKDLYNDPAYPTAGFILN